MFDEYEVNLENYENDEFNLDEMDDVWKINDIEDKRSNKDVSK